MRNHREQPSGSLFFRIMFQLSVSLILLATVLTALQVNNQFGALNKFHLAQGQWIFTSLGEKLRNSFQDIQSDENLASVDRNLKAQMSFYNLSEVSLFDYLKKKPANPKDFWGPEDLMQIEKCLIDNRRDGKPYRITLNKETKHLIAYLPFILDNDSGIYIARASIPVSDFKQAVSQSRSYLLLMVGFIIFAGAFIGYNLSKSIIKPVRALNRASQEIIRGNLGKKVYIETGDELEVLANTFNHMSLTLEEMQKKAIDANPLTQLPGNQGIFNQLKNRIFERQKFVLFHIDLDRFKVFNDHYGLAQGDKAIQYTSDLLKSCVAEKGAHDDYIGHQGGDDFVVITRPQKAEQLAQAICDRFDKEVVPKLYTAEDIKRGTTRHMDRRHYTETGEERQIDFPLLAVSVAGVSTAKKDLADYFQCMNLAAEMKKEAKKNVKSSYIINESF